VVKVLLVDDNPAILQMLDELLSQEFIIVGKLSAGQPAIEAADRSEADVILLDISLGDLSGFEVAEYLKKRGSKARIVFLSVHENPAFIQAGLRLGAYGYVFKSNISRDLVTAINAASRGEFFLPRVS